VANVRNEWFGRFSAHRIRRRGGCRADVPEPALETALPTVSEGGKAQPIVPEPLCRPANSARSDNCLTRKVRTWM